MTLKDLPIGKTATVRTVGGEGALRHHFLDMGLIPTASVTMVKYAPMGDPVEVRIHSYELTSFGWRIAQISAKQEITRMVSATLSPLEAELESAEAKPRTRPPKFSIAASKLKRVRVLGS